MRLGGSHGLSSLVGARHCILNLGKHEVTNVALKRLFCRQLEAKLADNRAVNVPGDSNKSNRLDRGRTQSKGDTSDVVHQWIS